MLVIVHDHQAVGAGSQPGVIVVFICDRDVHIKPETARMQVMAQFLDQRQKPWLRFQRNFLKVDGSALESVTTEVKQKLRAEGLPRRWIHQKISDGWQPLLAYRFIIVDERKDFDLSFFSPQKRHHAIV